MKVRGTYRLLLIALAAALSATGCIKEDHAPADGKSGSKTLTLTLSVPGSDVATKAISATEESHIETLDILVFKDNGAGNSETFLYHVVPQSIINSSVNQKQFKATLKLSNGSDRHRFVILANSRGVLGEVIGQITETTTKEQVRELIKFGVDKWNTASSSNFAAIPMWGESKGTHTITTTSDGATLGTIKMIRALARIDVGVNIKNVGGNPVATGFSGSSKPTFKINEIRVYNTNTQAYTAPHTSTDVYSSDPVYAPNVPAGVQTSTPVVYEYTDLGGVLGSIGEIYTGEVNNANPSAGDDIAFLLVSGYYTPAGAAVNVDTPTWYRVDFYDRKSETPAADRIDILRNHHYTVNITSVDGPGYSDPKDAENSSPVHMEADVVRWNDKDLGNVVFDGNHSLTVSRSEMMLSKRHRENNRLQVTTTLDSYSISITDSPEGDGNPVSWFEEISEVNGLHTFRVYANDGATERDCYIHVTAGRMTNVVKVTQLTVDILSMELSPLYEVNFINIRQSQSQNIEAKTLTIHWDPMERPIRVTKKVVSNEGVEFTVNEWYYGGEANIIIQPQKMNDALVNGDPFREAISSLELTLEGDEGMKMIETVYVRLKSYGVKIKSMEHSYPMMGSVVPEEFASLMINANTPWTARLENTSGSLQSLRKSSGNGSITTGETISFVMNVGNSTKTKSTTKIIISSTYGLFPDFEIPVLAYWGWPFTYGNSHYYAGPDNINPVNSKIRGSDADDKCKNQGYPNGSGYQWRAPTENELKGLYAVWSNTAAKRKLANFEKSDGDWYHWSRDTKNAFPRYVNMSNGSGGDYSPWVGYRYHHVRCITTQF